MKTIQSKCPRKSGLIPMIIFAALLYGFNGYSQQIVISQKSSSVHTTKSRWKNNDFKIEYKGDIEINDDDTDIVKISRGGYFEVSKTTFGSRRSILIESSGGELRREYYEGRRKTNYEPEGRKWLAEILPEIVRSTGIAAESRVNRYYRKGGANAVLDEIERLDSDYTKAIYAEKLLDKSGLSDNDLVNSLEVFADEINSDYYLTTVLKSNSDKFLKSERTSEAYFEAVDDVSSDYYAMSILSSAVEDCGKSEKELSRIMEACKDIGSDYYQSSLLSKILEINDLDDETVSDLIIVSKDIGSDYYQSQILAKAMEVDGLSNKSFNQLIEAVSDVSSDYHMATVFTKVLDNDIDESVKIKIIDLVDDKMSSDYYSSVVLSKMIEDQRLEGKSIEEFAEAISDINSSTYAAGIIKKAADNDNLSDKALISLIKASGDIDSDYYKSSALQSLADAVKRSSNRDVREAYRSAAKEISSDTYYGRAMRAID